MTKLYLTFLLCIPFLSFTQKTNVDRPDLTIEPKPYNLAYFNDKNDYSTIKELTIISKGKHNDFLPDTLYKKFYNDHGLLVKNMDYDDNKLGITTIFKYSENNQLLSWQSFNVRSVNSNLTIYDYNENRQVNSIRQVKIKNRNGQTDTIEISTQKFTYKNKQLIEVLMNNSWSEKYEYNQNKISFKKGGYVSKSFKYNSQGNLIQIYDYMGSEILPLKLMGTKTFTYNQANQLVTDSILTSNNIALKKHQITNYTYNENGALKSMNVTYGYKNRFAEFNYSDDRIQQVKLETNDLISAYLRIWISPRIGDLIIHLKTYEEKFKYDKFGNKTLKQVFTNKKLFSEVEYKIVYKN